MKIVQRMFPYGEEEKQNVIPLQDAEGNNVTDSAEIVRGSKIAPVLSVSFYFMPDGGFGIKFEISLREGIRILSSPEATEGPKRVLYSFKRKKSIEDDSDPEPSSKRVRVRISLYDTLFYLYPVKVLTRITAVRNQNIRIYCE